MGPGVEAPSQGGVAGRLQEGRREPGHGDQYESSPHERNGDPWRGPDYERDGGRGFEEHRRPDDEAGHTGVPNGVDGETRPAYAGEEGVVYDLDEPDYPDHEKRRRGVGEQQQGHLVQEVVCYGQPRKGCALDLGLAEGVAAEEQRRILGGGEEGFGVGVAYPAVAPPREG